MSRAAVQPASRLSRLDRTVPSRPRLGYLLLLCVPITAGVAPIRSIQIGGLGHAVFLFALFVGAAVLIVLTEAAVRKDLRPLRVFRPWMAWFGYVWLSLLWCERVEPHNVSFAIQMSMPLAIGGLGLLLVRTTDQLRLLIRCFTAGLVLLTTLAVAYRAGVLPNLDRRPAAIAATMIACVFVAGFARRSLPSFVGWLLCAAVAAITGGRMAFATILLLPAIAPTYGSVWRRCGVVAIIAGIGTALFLLTPLHERFAGGQLSTLGRLDAWPLILEEAWTHPILGAGVDSASEYVPTVWPRMDAPHNEYLRVGFEFGVVGLVILLGVVAWQMVDLKRWMDRSDGWTRQAFAACFLGLIALLITACTDNTLGYSLMFMNPLFALMGAAYGVTLHGEGPRAAASAAPGDGRDAPETDASRPEPPRHD